MSARDTKHVVLLMFENRSFDHMLGLLDHPGLPTVLDDHVANPIDPANPNSPAVAPYALDSFEALGADPKHGFSDVMRQLTGKPEPWQAPYQLTNSGFAWNYHEQRSKPGKDVLGCYPPAMLPVLSTLATEYAVCARWFCSVPSETWPNRLFAHAACSDNLLDNDDRLYDNRTIFEALSHAKKHWQIYAGDIPQVAAFHNLWWHDGGLRFSRYDAFLEHARQGTLPSYSFIEPRHFGAGCESQHPLSKVQLGEQLLASVYQALTSNADAWQRTLLIVTYDEHGGFYDRQPPAAAVPPTAGVKDPKYGFAFDLLGPRVPAVVISPWIEWQTVDKETRDHTTVMATLRDLFGFTETLTDRDKHASSLLPLLTRTEPRDPAPLPPIPKVRAAELGPDQWAEGVNEDGTIQLNDLQQQLVNLATLIDNERKPRPGERGLPQEPPPPPVFRSEAEVGEFVEAFRRRHLDEI